MKRPHGPGSLRRQTSRTTSAGGRRRYRLPTEAQWEYACRAGESDAWSFGPGSDKREDFAWLKGRTGYRTHPVGQKKPNAWGLYDMHGNVLEWCADFYGKDYYAKSPVEDPTGPPSGGTRVVRGGNFVDGPVVSTSTYRFGWGGKAASCTHGFRVVCEVSF